MIHQYICSISGLPTQHGINPQIAIRLVVPKQFRKKPNKLGLSRLVASHYIATGTNCKRVVEDKSPA